MVLLYVVLVMVLVASIGGPESGPALAGTPTAAFAQVSAPSTDTANPPSPPPASTAVIVLPGGASGSLPNIEIDPAAEAAALAEGYDLRQIANVSGHLPELVLAAEIFTLEEGASSLVAAYVPQDPNDSGLQDAVVLGVQLFDGAFLADFFIQIFEAALSDQQYLEPLIQEMVMTEELFDAGITELTADTLDAANLGDEAFRITISGHVMDQEFETHMIFFSRDRLVLFVVSEGLSEEDAMAVAAELDARAVQLSPMEPSPTQTPAPAPPQPEDDRGADADDGAPTFTSIVDSDEYGQAGPGGAFTSVSAGTDHTCGVRTDGAVACWGSNEDWLGSYIGQATPPGGAFDSVSAGAAHTCGVRTDGSIECWGQNAQGQATPLGFSFSSVSAGAVHTCGVRTDGAVECWGSNEDGQAGPPGGTFTSVSAGTLHTCGVRTDGAVACWGNDGDAYGFFGHGAPPDGAFSSVSAGTLHTCGVRTDGSIECWGSDSHGRATPPGGAFASVSAGTDHTCGVRTDGSIECWGSNEDWLGSFIGQATPPGGAFASVSAGLDHTCGVRTDGAVACWGSNEDGQATPSRDHPTAAEIPYDDHPNTGKDATPITVGKSKVGRLNYERDVDFFVFEAEKDKFYRIDVLSDTLRYALVGLYDANVRPLVSNDWSEGIFVSSATWKAPRTESHHVSVTGPDIGTGSYILFITQYEGADDYPDSVLEAKPAAANETVQGSLDYHGDADVFAFEAGEGSLYRIDVGLETLSDSVVTLYGADGEVLASNDDRLHSLASLIHWGAPHPGEYYVEVTGYGTGSYTLTIISDVTDEHGNLMEEASPVEVGDPVQGALDYAGDVDFFVFEADEGKSYRIEVTTDTLTDYTMTWYGPDGEWGVSVTSNSQGFPSHQFLEAESSGSYHIRMDGGLDNATGSYTLSISVQ